jgi:antirestriction protein ArdC
MDMNTYQAVTDQIIAAIERGAGTWQMPWHNALLAPVNAVSKKPYRGINILALWAAAEQKGYASGIWATYRQWNELRAQVRRGEKSTLVVFWNIMEETVDEEIERHCFARSYFVFNAAQVFGYNPPVTLEPDSAARIEQAEQFFTQLNAKVEHGGFMACYIPSTDTIHLPRFEAFESAGAYYATRAHETCHWSGHESRLNRDLKNRFGSEAYAAEELVAELGAAFLCAELGLAAEPRQDHAQYIQAWLKVLREDSRAIFTTASKAQAAVDWLKSATNA